MRSFALVCFALVCSLPLVAQSQTQTLVRENDTLTYRYVPLEIVALYEPTDSLPAEPADTARRGFFRRVVDYFGQANVDRTFEKKIDYTFIGGPSYSSTTKLGLGLMGAGLYRIDRTDSLTPPSDITLFGSASITGYYTVGIRGNSIFKHDKNRLVYRLSFASQPTDFWGVGYDAGAHNLAIDYAEKLTRVELTYLHRMARNFYMGAEVKFHYVKGKNFERHLPEGYTLEHYLGDMKQSYTSTTIGLVAQYDTRDFAPNPYKGVYLALKAGWMPDDLGTCGRDLWTVEVTASGYQRLWHSAILAMEFYGEFNSDYTPWPQMARLGGDVRMRGYYEGRYTDLDMLTAQVELRQRIWRRISCAVWGGAGTVFSGFGSRADGRSLSWSHILPNYGLGVRWEFKKRVNIRFDYGFGRDTSGLVVQINEAF